jgi:hypothetical protein
MKLSAPTTIVFWVAVALGVLGLLGSYGIFAVPQALLLLALGFVLLVAGNLFAGF